LQCDRPILFVRLICRGQWGAFMASPRVPRLAVTIGAVERETGLSKDTLRVWERRYGFPQPSRDPKGERLYPDDQVQKLHVIRRLMDQGVRPGKIVSAPYAELTGRVSKLSKTEPANALNAGAVGGLLGLIKTHRVIEFRQRLARDLLRLGLQRFVLDVIAPLNVLVGAAWAQGDIAIFEEHLYTEQIQHLLRQAIGDAAQAGQSPRVLLATVSGEEHQLGLLMAEACIAVEGAQCISLGVQSPVAEIARAAIAQQANIVGLSFSSAMQIRVAAARLAELREWLDQEIELWAGGSIWQSAHKRMPGVHTISCLSQIPRALADWRAAQR
jgi:MerR family transcriptional regulator, light-induced transcriptional regulator